MVISYCNEKFPFRDEHWSALFNEHGQEVRGRDMNINWQRYRAMELEGRLVWIVARVKDSGEVAGYSCHFWYIDLHFGDKVASDDMWYVRPQFRGKGIGRRVRELGLRELRAMNVDATYDLIRTGGPDLTAYGYEAWGTRWMLKL